MDSSAIHKILVIEDNPDSRQLACWILEDAEYGVVTAESAEEGLALLQSHAFSLVLMDISLPGMDGKDATRKIRSMPNYSGIPILALTAHAIQGEREAVLASGVDGLLTKPVDEDKLITEIGELLGSTHYSAH